MSDGMVVHRGRGTASQARGEVFRAQYSPHTSSATRAGVVIASSSVRLAADDGPGLGQRPLADPVAHPHAGGRGDAQRAGAPGTGRRHPGGAKRHSCSWAAGGGGPRPRRSRWAASSCELRVVHHGKGALPAGAGGVSRTAYRWHTCGASRSVVVIGCTPERWWGKRETYSRCASLSATWRSRRRTTGGWRPELPPASGAGSAQRCSCAAGCAGPRPRRSRSATSSGGMAGGASWTGHGPPARAAYRGRPGGRPALSAREQDRLGRHHADPNGRRTSEAAKPLSGPSRSQSFFDFTADLIAGSPNETSCAISASPQMYHGIRS